MEISSLSGAESRTQVSRMLKEFTGYFRNIKKTKAKIKVTVSKINKIYRESTVQWMKPRIKSMISNIRKKKTFNQNSKKKK